jgi:hypothetical protein
VIGDVWARAFGRQSTPLAIPDPEPLSVQDDSWPWGFPMELPEGRAHQGPLDGARRQSTFLCASLLSAATMLITLRMDETRPDPPGLRRGSSTLSFPQ